MRQPNPVHQCGVIWNLAAGAMSHKVELRHSGTTGGEFCEIEIEWWEVTREAALEVYAPLTCDVVCDEEAADPGVKVVGNRRRKDIVRVDVTVEAIC